MNRISDGNRKAALVGISTLLFGTVVATPTALAQERAVRGVLEEIIVTAEKRSANVQDIPVAISAFSQDALNEKGITDIQSLQESVPSLQFTTTGNFTSGAVVTMRGIGTDVTTSGADQGVALHLDGVYMGRSSAGLLSFYDLERLEVLRGPQGTLYGRNATGGSINLISSKPSDEFEAFGDVQVGNYNQFRVRGVVGGAVGDSVAGRLTMAREKRDGYIENLVPGGKDSHDTDDWGLKGQLRFDVSDSIEVLGTLYASETSGVGATVLKVTQPAAIMVGLVQPPPFFGTNIGVPNFQNAYTDALAPPESLHTYRANTAGSLEQSVQGANITVSWELENLSLKSITGWFENETDLFRDGDGSELDLYTKGRIEAASQFSQEFNLSSTGDGNWEWILGAYFFTEDIDDKETNILAPPNPSVPGGTGTLFSFASTVESTSWAFFGQTSYAFTEKLRGTLGLRYSVDDKDGKTKNRNITDLTNGLNLIGFPQSGAYGESWNEPTGKLGLDYFVNDDSMLYLSLSKGYKSGGLNINSPDQAVFDPEIIYAYEVGSKNRLLDNRLELNASAFYYDYTDLQLFSVTESAPFVQNAGESTIIGLEIESKFRATENLGFSLAFSYLDTEINDFVTKDPADPGPLQVFEDLSGNQLPRAPEFEVNVGVSYDWLLDSGMVTLSGQYHWQDDMYFRAQNDPDKRQDAYATVDARLSYQSNSGKWQVAAFGRNLTDEEAFTQVLIEAGLLGSPVLVSPNQPMTYGVEISYSFH